MSNIRLYSNGVTSVLWQDAKCVHCGNCTAGLPRVFNVDAKPWVNLHGASGEEIAKQVSECPSGALSIVPQDKVVSGVLFGGSVKAFQEIFDKHNTECKSKIVFTSIELKVQVASDEPYYQVYIAVVDDAE